MKKILVLDLDGTLTNSEKKITKRTKDAIMKMQEQGHTIVLATGRPTPGVRPIANELCLDKYNGYMLSYNGGKITNCTTNEVVYQQVLPNDIPSEIFALAEELNIGMMTYQQNGAVANKNRNEYMDLEARINGIDVFYYENPAKEITAPVNKCLGTVAPQKAEQIEKIYADHFGERINVGRSEPFFLELTPKGIDKAASLAKLCEILGCTKDSMIACGDGFNDKSMIEFAGLGVAMANAQETVKQSADYITLSNDEDGVAHVIEKFILAS